MRTKGECVAVVSKRKCSVLLLAALQCEVNKSRHGTAPPNYESAYRHASLKSLNKIRFKKNGCRRPTRPHKFPQQSLNNDHGVFFKFLPQKQNRIECT